MRDDTLYRKVRRFSLIWQAGVADLDVDKLRGLVDVARLSTAQLDRISHAVFGIALSEMSNASLPAEQARDMLAYARQYGELEKLTDALVYTSSGRPGVQNFLLGHDGMEDTRPQSVNIALDLVKLENRVERMFDKMDAKLDAAILEMRHMRTETAPQPIHLTGKMLAFLLFVLAAMVTGQIALLAWLGAFPHG